MSAHDAAAPVTPAGVEIREIHADEYEALGRVSLAAYQDLYGGELNPGYAAELVDVARRAVESQVLVAVIDGEIVGGVNYTSGPGTYWSTVEGKEEAGIRMLAVAPGAQGSGVGSALVDACVARAKAEGRARVSLHTMKPMTTAHRIYERAGFERAPARDWKGDGYELIAYVLEL